MSRILLVEGYEGIRDFLSRRLQRRGCDVIVVTDGQQGVDRARAGQSDIVLPDMDLPAMHGWTDDGRDAGGCVRADRRTDRSRHGR